MIYVRLAGGLGNQMFQYALARQLAFGRGAGIKIDDRWYRRQSKRAMLLGGFALELDYCDEDDYAMLAEGKIPVVADPVVTERGWQVFDPTILSSPPPVYLSGYFQSWRYFEAIADEIRQGFTVATPPGPEVLALLHEVVDSESISLHIRRTDYLHRKHPRETALPLEYYRAALLRILERVDTPKLFVFSDDLAWARDHLDADCSCVFVDLGPDRQDIDDLRLMAACRHHIIANSTFSWWGAWLRGSPETSQLVYTPAHWIRSGLDTADLIPAEWEVIDWNDHSFTH